MCFFAEELWGGKIFCRLKKRWGGKLPEEMMGWKVFLSWKMMAQRTFSTRKNTRCPGCVPVNFSHSLTQMELSSNTYFSSSMK
jgi:hypothetical protein